MEKELLDHILKTYAKELTNHLDETFERNVQQPEMLQPMLLLSAADIFLEEAKKNFETISILINVENPNFLTEEKYNMMLEKTHKSILSEYIE